MGRAYGAFGNGFPKGTTPQDVGIYNDKLAMGFGIGPWIDYNLGSNLSVRADLGLAADALWVQLAE